MSKNRREIQTARYIQRALDVSYQTALQTVRSVHSEAYELSRSGVMPYLDVVERLAEKVLSRQMTHGEYTREFLLRTLDAYEEASVFALGAKLRQEMSTTGERAVYCVNRALRELIIEGRVTELRGGFVIRTSQEAKK